MSREWLFIQANDVLMFRDSRPFAAGQNFRARSLFPPTPRTMQGVIRSHYLEMREVEWAAFAKNQIAPEIRKAIGSPDSLGELTLSGPFVAQETNGEIIRLVQAPFDLMQPKPGTGTEERTPLILAPEREPSFKTNAPFKGWRALRPPKGENIAAYENAAGWLNEGELAAYLRGAPLGQIIPNERVFAREDRVGIGLSRHRTVQRSLFYEAQFIRTQPDIGLLVEVNAGLFPDGQGLIAIGGEGRSGWYRKVSYRSVLPKAKDGRVKVVLLTPAYFSGGWQPRDGNWSPWLGPTARLVSLAIGKPLLISGWDLARKRPRALHHYLPAGSVFFFEDAHISDKPFTETPPDSPDAGAMGFGAFATSNWDYL